MQPSRAIRYGTSFKDGKLYEFSSEGIIVLRQWPDLRAWRRTPKGSQWQQIRPQLRLRLVDIGWSFDFYRREPKIRSNAWGEHIRDIIAREPGYEEQEDDLIEAPRDQQNEAQEVTDTSATLRRYESQLLLRSEYLKSIPEEVISAVAPYSSRHWHLLNLIARCPGALDLIRSTPALAFALASLWAFRSPSPCQPLRAARALLRKSQPQIAAWLGFPSDRSTMRVLRKIEPVECTIPNLLHLRDLLLVHPKPLRHMRMLRTESLHIMARATDRYTVSDAYLCELGADPEPFWLVNEQALIRDVLWMRESLEETKTLTIHSHQYLRRAHDRLVERMGRIDLKILTTAPLPDPPFPSIHSDDLQLEPITEAIELIIEGRSQMNCVGAYAKRIRRGGLYVYRVLAPERATLAIARTRNDTWKISELKTSGNAEVMDSTRRRVEAWLGNQ